MSINYITRTIVATASAAATQSYNTSGLQTGGELLAAYYQRGTASAPSTQTGITVTAQPSGQVLLDVTATGTSGVKTWFYPTAQAQTTSGEIKSPSTANAGTSAAFPLYFPVAANDYFNIDLACATVGGTPANGSGGLNITFGFYVRGN